MISVAPKRGGKAIIGLLGRLWRGFLLEKVGEVKTVCQPAGTGVYLSQVSVCVCCFFKYQLVEPPPYPSWLSECSLEGAGTPVLLGTGWGGLCVL